MNTLPSHKIYFLTSASQFDKHDVSNQIQDDILAFAHQNNHFALYFDVVDRCTDLVNKAPDLVHLYDNGFAHPLFSKRRASLVTLKDKEQDLFHLPLGFAIHFFSFFQNDWHVSRNHVINVWEWLQSEIWDCVATLPQYQTILDDEALPLHKDVWFYYTGTLIYVLQELQSRTDLPYLHRDSINFVLKCVKEHPFLNNKPFDSQILLNDNFKQLLSFCFGECNRNVELINSFGNEKRVYTLPIDVDNAVHVQQIGSRPQISWLSFAQLGLLSLVTHNWNMGEYQDGWGDVLREATNMMIAYSGLHDCVGVAQVVNGFNHHARLNYVFPLHLTNDVFVGGYSAFNPLKRLQHADCELIFLADESVVLSEALLGEDTGTNLFSCWALSQSKPKLDNIVLQLDTLWDCFNKQCGGLESLSVPFLHNRLAYMQTAMYNLYGFYRESVLPVFNTDMDSQYKQVSFNLKDWCSFIQQGNRNNMAFVDWIEIRELTIRFVDLLQHAFFARNDVLVAKNGWRMMEESEISQWLLCEEQGLTTVCPFADELYVFDVEKEWQLLNEAYINVESHAIGNPILLMKRLRSFEKMLNKIDSLRDNQQFALRLMW